MVKKILVPTDLSDITKKSFQWAKELAGPLKASVVVLCVSDDVTLNMQTTSQEFRDVAEKKLRAKLEQFLGPESETGAEYVVRGGAAAQEIVKLADEMQIDLIVIGKTGRSAIADALLGSVAERVIHTARAPVVLIHPA